MPRLSLTRHLDRYVDWTPRELAGTTVADVLDAAFGECPNLRGYILDDQGRLRKHVQVLIDGEMVHDRAKLSDPVGEKQEVFVMQALSGG